jgi:hypothetical protein
MRPQRLAMLFRLLLQRKTGRHAREANVKLRLEFVAQGTGLGE